MPPATITVLPAVALVAAALIAQNGVALVPAFVPELVQLGLALSTKRKLVPEALTVWVSGVPALPMKFCVAVVGGGDGVGTRAERRRRQCRLPGRQRAGAEAGGPSVKRDGSGRGAGARTVTVAVSVTDCPAVDGFTLDASAVLVGAPVTVCVSGLLVLPVKFASPL